MTEEEAELEIGKHLPEELRSGHKAFTEWKWAMARSGKPLPPGGVFLLNPTTILADSLQQLWLEVVATLACPPECVEIKVDRDLGGLHHRLEVKLPDGWIEDFAKRLPPARVSDAGGMDKVVNTYVQAVIAEADRRFRENLQDRLAGLEPRQDLLPQVIVDVLDSGTKE